MDHAIKPGPNGSGAYERREANLKMIIVSAFGLMVTVLVVMLLMWGMFNVLKKDQQEAKEYILSPMANPGVLPPEPRLEEHPYLTLQKQRAFENQMLNGYSWADEKAGVVRIPIDRAMDILSQRGFPPPPPQPPAAKGAKGVKANAPK